MKETANLALLLDELTERHIELQLENGKLRFKAPAGAMSPELKERLTAQKENLILRLSGGSIPEPEILRCPASEAQARLWYFNQLQGPNCTYNLPLFLRMRGPVNKAALQAAFDDVVRRHQTLRCAFAYENQSLQLIISREVQVPWKETDLSDLDARQKDQALRAHCIELGTACIDLSQAPLVQVAFFSLTAQDQVLAMVFHHAICDGWSFAVIMQDLAACYTARAAGKPMPLAPLTWQFSDYLAWKNKRLENKGKDGAAAYWRERLAHIPACTSFPPDYSRPPIAKFEGASLELFIDATTRAKMLERARLCGASLSQLMLAAMLILQANCAGLQDVVIGLPLANRARREFESLIGMFVSIVPLVFHLEPNNTLREIITQVRKVCTEAMEHPETPDDDFATEDSQTRDLSMNPNYQTTYNFLPPKGSPPQQDTMRIEQQDFAVVKHYPKYDVSVFIDERDTGLMVAFEYSSVLYRETSVEAWGKAYLAIIERLVGNPEAQLKELPDFRMKAPVVLAAPGSSDPAKDRPAPTSTGQSAGHISRQRGRL